VHRVGVTAVGATTVNHPDALQISAAVMDKVRPGAIVLMHDGGGDRTQTVATLEAVQRDLSSQGYVLEALCQ
jgi:peptidoglycan/xylan/chitin deacetylase (PgdA/CDA1 family)